MPLRESFLAGQRTRSQRRPQTPLAALGIIRSVAPARLWPLGLYRVAGDSMLPSYRPGDLLLGLRWFRRPRPGQAVVATHAGRPLIKRLAAVTAGQATLLGDNAARSSDSRQFGPVPLADIEAVIIAKL